MTQDTTVIALKTAQALLRITTVLTFLMSCTYSFTLVKGNFQETQYIKALLIAMFVCGVTYILGRMTRRKLEAVSGP